MTREVPKKFRCLNYIKTNRVIKVKIGKERKKFLLWVQYYLGASSDEGPRRFALVEELLDAESRRSIDFRRVGQGRRPKKCIFFVILPWLKYLIKYLLKYLIKYFDQCNSLLEHKFVYTCRNYNTICKKFLLDRLYIIALIKIFN